MRTATHWPRRSGYWASSSVDVVGRNGAGEAAASAPAGCSERSSGITVGRRRGPYTALPARKRYGDTTRCMLRSATPRPHTERDNKEEHDEQDRFGCACRRE